MASSVQFPNFDDFPDEIILNICAEADTATLFKLSQSSSRINQICGEILEKRKKEYMKQQFLKMQANKILYYMNAVEYASKIMDKTSNGKENYIKINKYSSTFVIESISTLNFEKTDPRNQEFENEYRRLFPWILPELPPTQDLTYTMYERKWVRSVKTNDLNLVRKTIENALRMGYKP